MLAPCTWAFQALAKPWVILKSSGSASPSPGGRTVRHSPSRAGVRGCRQTRTARDIPLRATLPLRRQPRRGRSGAPRAAPAATAALTARCRRHRTRHHRSRHRPLADRGRCVTSSGRGEGAAPPTSIAGRHTPGTRPRG